ncbi:aspartyl-phosphate phosphatase [Geobacillus phage vB_GthS_PK2.1]|nr:aspartyl-phosphate phosphatase [Geobacillus phage vB_GthS_PK2.1]
MNKRLQKRIEQQRKKMIDLGMTKGLLHPETIRASQELDKLILEAQKRNRRGK